MSMAAGRHGAPSLKEGNGDAALSWEGWRAQWKGQGLDFDYFLGKNFSKLPANSFVIRKADFDDASKKDLYERYLRGWAAGLEFGKLNPRAATQIVMEQFPGLGSQMTPDVATESMMQLASVFGGRMDERKKWGFHLADSWQLFFDVGREIGQITGDFKVEDVVKNDYVDAANAFDAAKVKADADGFALSDAYKAVNVDEIMQESLTCSTQAAAPSCAAAFLPGTIEAAMFDRSTMSASPRP